MAIIFFEIVQIYLVNYYVNISYAKSTLLNILLLFMWQTFAYTNNGKQKKW